MNIFKLLIVKVFLGDVSRRFQKFSEGFPEVSGIFWEFLEVPESYWEFLEVCSSLIGQPGRHWGIAAAVPPPRSPPPPGPGSPGLSQGEGPR